MNNEIAERDSATALELAEQAAAAVAAAQAQEYDDEPLQTPILKIGQGLTREVSEGDAEVGEFINTLTGNSLGTAVEFIVGFYQKGRFASDQKSGRAFTAFDSTIPATWEPLVGAEFVGTPFAEYSEAEEKFKEAVNENLREWDNGPLVSTTWNYTGLVLVPAEDDDAEEGEIDYQPARLSLKRIDKPAHRKLQTLLRAVLRNKPPWDAVIRLETHGRDFGRHTAYTVNPANVKIVRKTTSDEKLLASEVATAAMQGRAQSAGADEHLADTPAAPAEPDGDALAVS